MYDKHMEEKLIFFDLLYWSKLEVRYCINVIYAENMCVIV